MVTIGPRSMSDNGQLTWHHMSLIEVILSMARGHNYRTTAHDRHTRLSSSPEGEDGLLDGQCSAHTCHMRR